MRTRRSILIFTLGLTLMMIFACGKKEREGKGKASEVKGPAFDNALPGEEGMKNAIFGYNQANMDAYLSDRHIKFIRKYATDKETKRVFVFINTDRERGLAMAMRMNNMQFENISTSEKVSFADTSENWDFHYLDIKTSKPVDPVREMRYKLRYFLEQENGKWVVAKLKEREKAVIGEYTPPRWSLKGK